MPGTAREGKSCTRWKLSLSRNNKESCPFWASLTPLQRSRIYVGYTPAIPDFPVAITSGERKPATSDVEYVGVAPEFASLLDSGDFTQLICDKAEDEAISDTLCHACLVAHAFLMSEKAFVQAAGPCSRLRKFLRTRPLSSELRAALAPFTRDEYQAQRDDLRRWLALGFLSTLPAAALPEHGCWALRWLLDALALARPERRRIAMEFFVANELNLLVCCSDTPSFALLPQFFPLASRARAPALLTGGDGGLGPAIACAVHHRMAATPVERPRRSAPREWQLRRPARHRRPRRGRGTRAGGL